jgi:hypothetical protein
MLLSPPDTCHWASAPGNISFQKEISTISIRAHIIARVVPAFGVYCLIVAMTVIIPMTMAMGITRSWTRETMILIVHASSKLLITGQRHRLKADIIEATQCLRMWLIMDRKSANKWRGKGNWMVPNEISIAVGSNWSEGWIYIASFFSYLGVAGELPTPSLASINIWSASP